MQSTAPLTDYAIGGLAMQEEKPIEEKIELWELVGDRWTLPISVLWEEGHAVIELANTPFLDAQRRVALETLEPLRNGTIYVASRETLERMARKSQFGNPQDVVEWRRVVAPALHFPKNAGVDEFLDAYCAKGVVQNRATVSAIYSTLCAHMLQWLMQGKPLPLIFATIYPLLFRQNWKELAHFHKMKGGGHWNLDKFLVAENVISKNERVCSWSLNLVHEKMFHDTTIKAESMVRQRLNHPKTYWAHVRARVVGQFENARFCYAEYIKAVRKTSLALVLGSTAGRRKSKKKRKRYRINLRRYSLKRILGRRLFEKEFGTKAHLSPKAPQLPAVSGVQPKTDDVRDTRKDIQR